jgi:hypothetical protein
MARQATGWLFTLIWSVTGLLQVAAPPCRHHGANTAAVGLSADPHAHHKVNAAAVAQDGQEVSETAPDAHAGPTMSAPHGDAPSVPADHSGHGAPCDCLTACCTTVPASFTRSAVAPVAIVTAGSAPPAYRALDAMVVPRADHRQPPATAPPGSRDC